MTGAMNAPDAGRMFALVSAQLPPDATRRDEDTLICRESLAVANVRFDVPRG